MMELCVGANIYRLSFGSKEISLIRIESTTKTKAICGELTFKIEPNSEGELIRIGGEKYKWHSVRYFLETPELKDRYDKWIALEDISSFNFGDLSLDELNKILKIINKKKK